MTTTVLGVEPAKLTSGQPRHFRELVGDFLDNRRPMGEIESEMAAMDRAQQVIWAEVKRLAERVHTNFPREGGQSLFTFNAPGEASAIQLQREFDKSSQLCEGKYQNASQDPSHAGRWRVDFVVTLKKRSS